MEITVKDGTLYLKGEIGCLELPKLVTLLEGPKAHTLIKAINLNETLKISPNIAAYLLHFSRDTCGQKIIFDQCPEAVSSILNLVRSHMPFSKEVRRGKALNLVQNLGKFAYIKMRRFVGGIHFLGYALTEIFLMIFARRAFRLPLVVCQMERSGIQAIPIVMLISFLVGAVVEYQGAVQLRKFGAELLSIDMMAIAILREIGVLLTSIVVAGRSASAYASEIGTMKLNEEVDALKMIGLEAINVLVVPRIMALIICLPLLVVVSDVLGVVGGMVVGILTLDVTPYQFLDHFSNVATKTMFWVGVLKAPLFALIIAITGCMQGIKVEGSSASIGVRTTRAVVQSLFLVIVANGLISILLAYLEI